MGTELKKRFIAGATCPQCKQLDVIRLVMEIDDERIECISCDYMEKKSDLENNKKTSAESLEKPVIWHKSVKSD